MTYNWLLTELLAQERLQALQSVDRNALEAARIDAEQRVGFRATLASAFVRIGMHLDDAAGRQAVAASR
jgi:hypothetical protein